MKITQVMVESPEIQRRFWAKVAGDTAAVLGCWIWTAARLYGSDGDYGAFGIPRPRRTVGAHRVAWVLRFGDEREGMELDHLCRHTLCVNPAHLQPVTHQVNIKRGYAAQPRPKNQATHCRRGHPYPPNARRDPKGARVCLPCAAIATQRYRERRVACG